MASGTITGSGWGVYAVIEWSSTKGTTGSTVSANLYAQNPSGWYWSATVNNGYSVTINGDTNSGSTSKLSATTGGRSKLISHSVSVSYTGEKSITISASIDCSNIKRKSTGEYIGVRTASGTAKLDKVGTVPTVPTMSAPTAAVITEVGKTVTISWDKSTSYNSSGTYLVRVSIDGGSYSDYKTISSLSTTSTTYAIPAGQGKTYQFAVRASNDVGNSAWSYSGVLTTNSISAPTVADIGTYNPYKNSLTITVSGGSQTNGQAFTRNCHIYYDWGGSNATGIGTCSAVANTSTTLTFNPSDAIKSTILSVLGTKSYSNANFYAVCWNENSNGTRSSYTTKKFTIDINTDGGAKPTIAAPTFSGGFTGYASTCFIAGIHNLTVTSGSALVNRAPSGTTLTYKIECTDKTAVTGSSATFTSLSAGKKTVKVTVTDSRGLSNSVTKECQFQSWAKPTIANIDGVRLDNPATSGKITYTLNYSPIYKDPLTSTASANQINGINTQQIYKDSAWSNYTSGTEITGLNTELSYTIKLRVADKIKTSDYREASTFIPTIAVNFAMRKWGIGINCVPTNGYGLDVSGDARVDGNITATGSVSQSSDRRLKTDFREVNVDKYLELIKLLKPTLYKYIDGDGHDKLGLIAQDVESAMDQVGLSEVPFILKDSKTDMYTLDYNQLGVLVLIGVQKALSA